MSSGATGLSESFGQFVMSAEQITAVGRDVECVVLARAVRWHVEHRVLMNGHKSVIFR